MSSVWLTSVLPAVVTGMVTTLLTLVITRANDRRKFKNDKSLAALDQRREIYAEMLRLIEYWRKAQQEVDEAAIDHSFLLFYPNLETLIDQTNDVARDISEGISDVMTQSRLKLPRQVRETGLRVAQCLYATVLPPGAQTYQRRLGEVRQSITALENSIDQDLGLQGVSWLCQMLRKLR